jgi:phage-related protein
MAITSAISDLFKSIAELFESVFSTAYSIVHSILLACFNFVSGIFALAGDILGGFIDITTGFGKFVLGNIVVVTIGALGAFAYVRYTAHGRQLAEGKKTN